MDVSNHFHASVAFTLRKSISIAIEDETGKSSCGERCRREHKLLAGPPKPVKSRRREEAKNNPRRRELRYKFP
jgi:hypothetical protein